MRKPGIFSANSMTNHDVRINAKNGLANLISVAYTFPIPLCDNTAYH